MAAQGSDEVQFSPLPRHNVGFHSSHAESFRAASRGDRMWRTAKANPILAAWLTGLALPAGLATIIAMLGLFPVGAFLPDISILSFLGLLLMVLMLAVAVPALGVVAAVVRRSWWPLAVALVALLGLVVGAFPGIAVYQAWEDVALKSAVKRSGEVVRAILAYEHASGRPPEDLTQLVPHFLAEYPTTGMAIHPRYAFGPNAGPCSKTNNWHLAIPLVGFDVDFLVYCPKRNYEALDRDSATEISSVGDWARSSFSSD